MILMFSYMVEDIIEVFTDDLCLVSGSFDHFFNDPEQVHKWCEECNIFLY